MDGEIHGGNRRRDGREIHGEIEEDSDGEILGDIEGDSNGDSDGDSYAERCLIGFKSPSRERERRG